MLKSTPSLWKYRKKLSDHEAEISLNVFTTFELSLSQIGSEQKRKSLSERRVTVHTLTLAAFTNASDVSENLFHIYIHENPHLPGWIRHFVKKRKWDRYRFEDALASSAGLSLLQIRQGEDSELYLSLHVLVAEWLKLRTNKKPRYIEAAVILAMSIMATKPDRMSFQARQSMISHMFMDPEWQEIHHWSTE